MIQYICKKQIKTIQSAKNKEYISNGKENISKDIISDVNLVLLDFNTNCEIVCSSSVKNTVGSLIGIALNL